VHLTFGLDVVLWVGQLRLGNHQRLDEIHACVRERLARLGVSLSRREGMYLVEAFCALLRAASLAKEDQEWRREVAKNGGIIVSIDGIKPDGGNKILRHGRNVAFLRFLLG
jgi:hypothetical protein